MAFHIFPGRCALGILLNNLVVHPVGLELFVLALCFDLRGIVGGDFLIVLLS